MHSRTFWLGEIQDVGFLPRVPEVAVTSWQLLEVFRGQRSSLHFTFFADASRTALCSVRTDSRACNFAAFAYFSYFTVSKILFLCYRQWHVIIRWQRYFFLGAI